MSWYVAECLYHSVLDENQLDDESLSERRYFLLKADGEEEALNKAHRLAKSKEHSYRNALGGSVTWRLDPVEAAKEVLDGELKEGTEIYHKYTRRRKESPEV